MLIHKILFSLSGRWPTGASSVCFGLTFRTFLDYRDVWEMVFVGRAILFFLHGLLRTMKKWAPSLVSLRPKRGLRELVNRRAN